MIQRRQRVQSVEASVNFFTENKINKNTGNEECDTSHAKKKMSEGFHPDKAF
jgi:hypothetical protein